MELLSLSKSDGRGWAKTSAFGRKAVDSIDERRLIWIIRPRAVRVPKIVLGAVTFAVVEANRSSAATATAAAS